MEYISRFQIGNEFFKKIVYKPSTGISKKYIYPQSS